MSAEIDPSKFIVLTPQAQKEDRYRAFLKKHTFMRVCVRAFRDLKSRTVSYQIGVFGVDVATEEALRFDVPAYPPKQGQSVEDMIMLRAANPAMWPQFFLNNRDRLNNNAIVCLRGVIGAYRTLYNMDIEWYEDALTTQLKDAYNESLKAGANPEHILIALLLDVWPGVVQQKSVVQKTSPSAAPITVSKALEHASEEQTASERKPEPESRRKPTRATRVAPVQEA